MKTFRHLIGHEAGQTMTVNDLKKKLEEYPDDMPVFAEWEGCWCHVVHDRFTVKQWDIGYPEDFCDCLVIDVNEY